MHYETYFDFPAFSADPELRDSMRLMQRYSLEPFMTLRQFFYPRVVMEFYHTMTSRRVPHPTVIHFSIDGREGTLRVDDIAASFHFPIVLANSADYMMWPHPLLREMVRILSKDMTQGLYFSGDSFPRACSLSTTSRGSISFHSSILYNREELYWRLYTAFLRVIGPTLLSSS